MMASQIHIEPADHDWHRGISAHNHHEQSSILQMQVIMHGNEDAESGNDYTDTEYREAKSVPGCI